ncbi:MAG: glutamate synthase [Rhodospirillaceae bacterium]|nr:MAG: glutamate synthase [Rhodospirillaceae bacterium]
MLKKIIAVAVVTGLWAGTANAAGTVDTKALMMEGKGLIKGFATELVGELKKGMKAGGPIAAIGVCNIKAMPITDKHTAEASGWTIKRSSHKLRNTDNQPDTFEARAIKELLARQANGEKAKDMAVTMVTIEDGKKTFRMVKAIPTGKPCLACHGSDIKPEVAAKLDSLYPNDKARGFKMGEMRGIFSLKKEL